MQRHEVPAWARGLGRPSRGDTPVSKQWVCPAAAGRFSLNPRRYLSKSAQEKAQRNASRLAWHSVGKEIQDPSAQNVPQEEDEVVPSEHPQEEEKWDTANPHPGERLEGTKTYSESGITLAYSLPWTLSGSPFLPTLPLPDAGDRFLPTAHWQLSKHIFFLPHLLLQSRASAHRASVSFLITVGDEPSRHPARVKAATAGASGEAVECAGYTVAWQGQGCDAQHCRDVSPVEFVFPDCARKRLRGAVNSGPASQCAGEINGCGLTGEAGTEMADTLLPTRAPSAGAVTGPRATWK